MPKMQRAGIFCSLLFRPQSIDIFMDAAGDKRRSKE